MNDTLVHHWALMLTTHGAEAVADGIRHTVSLESHTDDSYSETLLALARDAADIRITQWTLDAWPQRWVLGVGEYEDDGQYPLLVESRRLRELE